MKRLLLLSVAAFAITSQACKKPAETAAGSAPAAAPAASPATAAPAAPPAGPAGAASVAPPALPGAPPAAKPMPPTIPNVLAKVNGEAIERWEFDNAVKRMESRAGGPVPPDRRDEVLRGVLDQLVAYHLLAQESRARKIEVSRRRGRRAHGSDPTELPDRGRVQAGHRGAGADRRSGEAADANRASRSRRSSTRKCRRRLR